ncbi:hypothetical protein OG871_24780 [Kitasatospora sp. NBC_00374]|uniref:hypothetical protein n=1 Tax=Kitasatospora sp. NBC_00374 TaxID=2975964 RepID=UPI00325443A6
MALRQIGEIPLGGAVLRVEAVGPGGREVVLSVTGPGASGRLRLPVEDAAGLRGALDRVLAAVGAGPDASPEADLVRRFHAGESIARIAARYGRTPDAVRARLRELGHDPRHPEHCPRAPLAPLAPLQAASVPAAAGGA